MDPVVTRRRVTREAVEHFENARVLAAAQVDAIDSQLDDLRRELVEIDLNMLESLGRRLIEIRKRFHITQKELGEAIGKTQQHIQRLEAGAYAQCSLANLHQITSGLLAQVLLSQGCLSGETNKELD